jgi:hypothetical protein
MNQNRAGHRCLVLTTLMLSGHGASAAEVCFTGINLAVPATTEGLYVNLANGNSGPTEAAVPGFDIDIYAAASTNPSGQLRFYWGPPSTGGAGVATVGDTYAVLGDDQPIGPDSLFTRAAFTGDTAAWQAGVTGYLGLRFRDESDAGIKYGWLQLTTSPALGFPTTINGWCHEASGSAISTPATGLLFASGFET